VGAVARDSEGHVAVAVSTGGVNMKLPGRVGDSPIPGAGFFADDALGAACGTGVGEAFMRLCLSRAVLSQLASGMTPGKAAESAIELLGRRIQGEGGLILVSPQGEVGVAYNSQFMAWAMRRG
jgi:beta-aspartyl-peptidase (threonine type)